MIECSVKLMAGSEVVTYLPASTRTGQKISAEKLEDALLKASNADLSLPTYPFVILLTRSCNEYLSARDYSMVRMCLSPKLPEELKPRVIGGIWLLASNSEQQAQQKKMTMKAITFVMRMDFPSQEDWEAELRNLMDELVTIQDVMDNAFLEEMRRFRMLLSMAHPQESLDISESQIQDVTNNLLQNDQAEMHKTLSGGVFNQCTVLVKSAGTLSMQRNADRLGTEKLEALEGQKTALDNLVADLVGNIADPEARLRVIVSVTTQVREKVLSIASGCSPRYKAASDSPLAKFVAAINQVWTSVSDAMGLSMCGILRKSLGTILEDTSRDNDINVLTNVATIFPEVHNLVVLLEKEKFDSVRVSATLANEDDGIALDRIAILKKLTNGVGELVKVGPDCPLDVSGTELVNFATTLVDIGLDGNISKIFGNSPGPDRAWLHMLFGRLRECLCQDIGAGLCGVINDSGVSLFVKTLAGMNFIEDSSRFQADTLNFQVEGKLEELGNLAHSMFINYDRVFKMARGDMYQIKTEHCCLPFNVACASFHMALVAQPIHDLNTAVPEFVQNTEKCEELRLTGDASIVQCLQAFDAAYVKTYAMAQALGIVGESTTAAEPLPKRRRLDTPAATPADGVGESGEELSGSQVQVSGFLADEQEEVSVLPGSDVQASGLVAEEQEEVSVLPAQASPPPARPLGPPRRPKGLEVQAEESGLVAEEASGLVESALPEVPPPVPAPVEEVPVDVDDALFDAFLEECKAFADAKKLEIKQAYMNAYMNAMMYACMHDVCIHHTYMHTCMHAYIHAYMHTYMHT